jgi:hypothetical protein
MRKTTLSLATAIALVAAPSALAADRTATLAPASPSFAWDGGPGTSVGTNAPLIGGISVGNFAGCFDGVADCDETLLKVDAPGKLTLTTDSADDTKDVLDMYVYETGEDGSFSESGPFGVPPGDDDMAEGGGASTTGDEKIELQVSPGYYVVQIKFFLAEGDTYKGTATLSGFPKPAEPVVTPVVDAPPAPAAAPAEAPQAAPTAQAAPAPAAKAPVSKKAACQKKAKKIKNKAKRKKALKKCAKLR